MSALTCTPRDAELIEAQEDPMAGNVTTQSTELKKVLL